MSLRFSKTGPESAQNMKKHHCADADGPVIEPQWHLSIQKSKLCFENFINSTIHSYVSSLNIKLLNINPLMRDLTTGYDNTREDGVASLPVSRSSHMITLWLDSGVVCCSDDNVLQ